MIIDCFWWWMITRLRPEGRKWANMKWDCVPLHLPGVKFDNWCKFLPQCSCYFFKLISQTFEIAIIDKTNLLGSAFPNVISNLISLLTLSISPFNNFPPGLWLWDTLFHFYNALVVTIWQNFLDKLDHFEGRFEKENVSTKEDWPFTLKKRFSFSIIKLISPQTWS